MGDSECVLNAPVGSEGHGELYRWSLWAVGPPASTGQGAVTCLGGEGPSGADQGHVLGTGLWPH